MKNIDEIDPNTDPIPVSAPEELGFRLIDHPAPGSITVVMDGIRTNQDRSLGAVIGADARTMKLTFVPFAGTYEEQSEVTAKENSTIVYLAELVIDQLKLAALIDLRGPDDGQHECTNCGCCRGKKIEDETPVVNTVASTDMN
jgi:hypothetical protein